MGRVCSVPSCDRSSITRGLCPAHYQRKRRTGSTQDDVPLHKPGALAWLWDNCQPGHDDCVIWPFAISANGYGVFRNAGVLFGAHVEACEVTHGPRPTEAHEVAHGCGNRACVNGRHLRWATRKENAADRLTHGTQPFGEACGRAKLTNEQARAIMQDMRLPREIAREYGVSRVVVDNIKRGKSYRVATVAK